MTKTCQPNSKNWRKLTVTVPIEDLNTSVRIVASMFLFAHNRENENGTRRIISVRIFNNTQYCEPYTYNITTLNHQEDNSDIVTISTLTYTWCNHNLCDLTFTKYERHFKDWLYCWVWRFPAKSTIKASPMFTIVLKVHPKSKYSLTTYSIFASYCLDKLNL